MFKVKSLFHQAPHHIIYSISAEDIDLSVTKDLIRLRHLIRAHILYRRVVTFLDICERRSCHWRAGEHFQFAGCQGIRGVRRLDGSVQIVVPCAGRQGNRLIAVHIKVSGYKHIRSPLDRTQGFARRDTGCCRVSFENRRHELCTQGDGLCPKRYWMLSGFLRKPKA